MVKGVENRTGRLTDNQEGLSKNLDRLTTSASNNYPITQVRSEFLNALLSVELEEGVMLPAEVLQTIIIEKTPSNQNGDYGIPCFKLAKILKGSPIQIAEELAKKLNAQLKVTGLITRFEAIKGYVNLHIDYEKYGHQVVSQIIDLGPTYGSENIGAGRHVVIDFSSPNIAKRMSVGHLRSTVIGAALSNIYDFLGYKVTRDNHIGDWGTGFGHVIYAIKTWGDMDKIATNPIPELQDLYVKVTAEIEKETAAKKLAVEAGADPGSIEDSVTEKAGAAYFIQLEQGDSKLRELWQQIVEWSLVEFQKMYDLLDIQFDETMGESYFEGELIPTIERIKELGISTVHEGALVVPLTTAEGEENRVIIQKSDGGSLYMTRDIATAIYRFYQMKAEEVIYVVGEEQRPHFNDLFAILKLMKIPIADYAKHVYFGLLRLPEGKMSTRKGRVILLEELINEAFSRAQQVIEKKLESNPSKDKEPLTEDEKQTLIKQVAVGAIKWSDLMKDPKTSSEFNMDKSISLEGKSALYVQYAYTRAQSVLEGANLEEVKNLQVVATFPIEKELIKVLAEFPLAIQTAKQSDDPSVIADSVYSIAQTYNQLYNQLRIADAKTTQDRITRLSLTACVAQTIRNGLSLLGIESPRRM